jgi:hypothetical protein
MKHKQTVWADAALLNVSVSGMHSYYLILTSQCFVTFDMIHPRIIQPTCFPFLYSTVSYFKFNVHTVH